MCVCSLGAAGHSVLEGGSWLADPLSSDLATIACSPGPLGLECVFVVRSARKGPGQRLPK